MPPRRSLPIVFALGLASCAAGEKHPLLTRLHYDGPGAEAPWRLSARGRLPERSRSARILVGRAAPGTGEIELKRSESLEAQDEKQTHRLAGTAQWTLTKELGTGDELGLTVVIFPVESLHACILEAEMPAEEGMAFGVPSLQGALAKEHASTFLYGLVYSCVKEHLLNPAVAGNQLTHRDPQCEWIADGMARLLATKALLQALRDEHSLTALAPLSFLTALEAEKARGVEAVTLIDSPRNEAPAPSSRALRQATAEYLMFRWYAAALRNGVERPAALFVDWARKHPLGPTYEELTELLRRTSGVRVAQEAESTPLDSVLEYHRANWLHLGWTRQKPKDPGNP